ncbi:MAG TPA: alpha/beta fold hydrolase [Qipengyuania sp.]|nr:alpha/beta fold hydrolase [Qipengyuania sp.]
MKHAFSSAAALLGLSALFSTAAAGDPGPLAGERFANAPGPVKQWYRVAGKAEGISVIILHGGPGQGSMVFEQGVGAQLEKVARVVYYDQRGAGRSERPKDHALYSIPILIEDIEALRRTLGGERIVLLGHSFGTLLALEYAAKYPQHTAGLVLAGAAFDFPALIDAMCDNLARAKPDAFARATAAAGPDGRCNPFAGIPDDAERKAWTEANMFPDPFTARKVETWDSVNGLANTGELGGAIFAQGLLSYRFSGTDRLTMPVLLIDGAEDHQTALAPQQTLAAAIPRGEVRVYEGAGHFMFVEQPERFARDVAQFLATLND